MKELGLLVVAVITGLIVVLHNATLTFHPAGETSTPTPAPFLITIPLPTAVPVPVPVIPTLAAGFITDVERFALARVVGWSISDAYTAVAISIAEDGSGDPARLSPANRDGSHDLGLWQINSGWWPQFGGQTALENPMNNALAAFAIYQRQGWCAWSTYESSCGPGHVGSYAAFVCRAQVAGGVAGHC